jgi:hypothetical protein
LRTERPRFVSREFEDYLKCGGLERGVPPGALLGLPCHGLSLIGQGLELFDNSGTRLAHVLRGSRSALGRSAEVSDIRGLCPQQFGKLRYWQRFVEIETLQFVAGVRA